MKKIGLLVLSLSAITGVSSCSLFSRNVWSWEKSTSNDTINYCLLIGQEDHNDSNDRTRGVRNFLNTRPPKEQQKLLPNLEDPIEGSITLKGDITPGGSIQPKTFKVVELEHREQKSLAGTTWDPITANGSAATWTAKHGDRITMFISNNDGMAEGALGASCWYKGMPIFGYDANKSTLRFIRSGHIMGTIDSNTPSQCLSSAMIIRNICDHDFSKDQAGYKFNPCSIGFKTFPKRASGWEQPNTYGYVDNNVSFEGCDDADIDSDANHAILVDNVAITDFTDYGKYFNPGEVISVNDYFNADGSEKDTQTRASEAEKKVKAYPSGKKLKVLHSYYSNTDVYFSGNMDPFFKYYDNMFNIETKRIDGDATNEDKLINAVTAAIEGQRSQGGFDAFLLNVIKQPNCMLYIENIAKKLNLSAEEDWSKRSNIPIVFWNRQPTDDQGVISKDVMHNKYFKYTYYVGFGAKQGGDLQGKMVASWLNQKYVETEKAKKVI